MQHTRKALLALLVLGAVVLASVGSHRPASASAVGPSVETSAPGTAVSSGIHHDPDTTGEPDNGATMKQEVPPAQSSGSSGGSWVATSALGILRLTGWFWLMRQLGMGS